MHLKINNYRKDCPKLNIEESDKIEIVEIISKILINTLSKFDNKLHVAMQKVFLVKN